MVSLKQLFEWFTTGKFPTEAQFAEQFKSFWHKSERISQSSVLGLPAALADKATKEDIANVTAGLKPMGNALNMADLNTKPKRNNDSYFVLDQLDVNGDSYIFRYDIELDQWINTKQVVYKDVAKKKDLLPIESEMRGYYTGRILTDFMKKTCAIDTGYFSDGSLIAVVAHAISWETSNLQYMYFIPSTQKFYIQDYSLPKLHKDDVMYGAIDQNGVTTSLRGRNIDLGKYEPLYIQGYITSNTAILYLDFGNNGGYTLRNDGGGVLSNQGSDYAQMIPNEIVSASPSNSTYIYFNKGTKKLESFDYYLKPSESFKTRWYIGVINPSSKTYQLNALKVVVNGDLVAPFHKSQAEAITQLGQPLKTFLPTENWIDKSWNSVLGTDGIFFDSRCIISKTNQLQNIKLYCKTAGKVRIHLTDLNFKTIYYEDKDLNVGVNNTMIKNIAYSRTLRVGIQNITGIVQTISPADNAGKGFKKTIATNVVSTSDYSFAYELETLDFADTVSGRVYEIEKRVNIDKIDDLSLLMLENDTINLEPKEYVLTETLANMSGKKFIGVRGKTVIHVPKQLKIGLDFRGVTDVVFRDITLIGAYNGTPTKSGLQPVRSGIINTKDDVYKWAGAGYNTDMVKGGITDEYIPQIGINLDNCERIEISGCEIKNFSWTGFSNRLSGKNYLYGIKVFNNYINHCYVGMELYDEAERSQYTSNNVALCQIGLFLDSGTNMFWGTAFNACRVGMAMSNGWNHAHGEFTDCPFTHNSLFSIIAKDIAHGQVFNGCKVGYVDWEDGNGGYCVVVENSRGFFFHNGKLINAHIKFDGKFYKHGKGYTIGDKDQFGNNRYIMQYEDVTGHPDYYNGGVNMFDNNMATEASFFITGGLDETNVVLMNNRYHSGRDSSELNN